jgi:hypothetical protein
MAGGGNKASESPARLPAVFMPCAPRETAGGCQTVGRAERPTGFGAILLTAVTRAEPMPADRGYASSSRAAACWRGLLV